MSGDKPLIYWDACVFLSWIKEEERGPGEMAGLKACAAEIVSGKSNLLTSAITFAEVLESKIGAEYRKRFLVLFKRENIKAFNVDIRVAKLASELRDYYVKLGSERKLSTPDALHLATAILYGADEFHTFDDGKSNKKNLGLLELNGNVGGHRLIVVKSGAQGQQSFEFKGPDEVSKEAAVEIPSNLKEQPSEPSAGNVPEVSSESEKALPAAPQDDPELPPPVLSVN